MIWRNRDVGYLTHLELARGTERCSLCDLLDEGGVDLVVGMADNGRSPASHVVDVLVAINIPAVGVLDTLKDNRLASHGLECSHGRVDATREKSLCLLEDLIVQLRCGGRSDKNQRWPCRKDIGTRIGIINNLKSFRFNYLF